ncbi:hypothetical protein BASA83_000756 [Batrachochytrium salamandrivorans]|nr:hypothetical protein BASA83_000756 [Batrachochytrium salamandrivorans]
MKVSFVSILTTAAIVISTVQCTSYSLWSAERRSGRVKCIPYTQQQRESVMGNVDRMIKSHYSGKANPYPDLDIFRKTYAGMTHEQFSLGLTRIFNKMRDKHTAFYKSGPYGCFSVTTGLRFQLVDDSLGSPTPPKVRVVGMTNTPKILNLIGNVLSTVDIGDELLTVNGMPFNEWYKQNKFILGFGANDSGGQRGAFKYLDKISGSSNILPEDDSITFQLRRLRGKQAIYTVTVPYVAFYSDECWSLSSNLYEELNSIASPEIPAPTSFIQKRSVSGNDTSLLGDRYRRNLFDIRGNSGGSIPAADGIIQLFKPDVTASQFRYLKNDVTKDLFYKGPKSKSPWSKAWRATSDISRYSGFGSMEDSSVSNTFGQAYFNPVGVYTNGACYSACEVFAAHIQDYGIGTVFGEDETTGGGGANVFFSDDEYFIDRPLQYIADPFTKKLTGKNPSHKFYTRISVGARQLIRGGNYAGQLVEDEGVKSDVIVRSTIDDILPGGKGISAYDRIANYLGDVAKRQMDGKTYFISEPYSEFVSDESIDIPFVASGVDEIIVVHQGEQLGRWQGELSALHQDCEITVKTPTGLQDHLVTYIGKKRGKQVFKTYRAITKVPTSNDRVSMMIADSYTVSGPSSGVGVYNFGSMSEQEGWNFNDGKWIIGDGISDYSGYMYSIVRVWLTAPVDSTISVSLDAVIDAYEDEGYFSLDMMDDFGEIFSMVSSTSDNGLTQYQPVTERNRVIKGTYSFTVTTEEFSLDMNFISYGMESPFSVKVNSIVITKDWTTF